MANRSADVYSGPARIGRVEARGRQFLAFVLEPRDETLRPIGLFSTDKAARTAILEKGARHAA